MKKGRMMRPLAFLPINCRASLAGQQKRATDCASYPLLLALSMANLRAVIPGEFNPHMLNSAMGLSLFFPDLAGRPLHPSHEL